MEYSLPFYDKSIQKERSVFWGVFVGKVKGYGFPVWIADFVHATISSPEHCSHALRGIGGDAWVQ